MSHHFLFLLLHANLRLTPGNSIAVNGNGAEEAMMQEAMMLEDAHHLKSSLQQSAKKLMRVSGTAHTAMHSLESVSTKFASKTTTVIDDPMYIASPPGNMCRGADWNSGGWPKKEHDGADVTASMCRQSCESTTGCTGIHLRGPKENEKWEHCWIFNNANIEFEPPDLNVCPTCNTDVCLKRVAHSGCQMIRKKFVGKYPTSTSGGCQTIVSTDAASCEHDTSLENARDFCIDDPVCGGFAFEGGMASSCVIYLPVCDEEAATYDTTSGRDYWEKSDCGYEGFVRYDNSCVSETGGSVSREDKPAEWTTDDCKRWCTDTPECSAFEWSPNSGGSSCKHINMNPPATHGQLGVQFTVTVSNTAIMMVADPARNGKKCGYIHGHSPHGGPDRTFKLTNGAATIEACKAACAANETCVAMSGIFGQWCIGCRTTLSEAHTGTGVLAFKKNSGTSCYVKYKDLSLVSDNDNGPLACSDYSGYYAIDRVPIAKGEALPLAMPSCFGPAGDSVIFDLQAGANGKAVTHITLGSYSSMNAPDITCTDVQVTKTDMPSGWAKKTCSWNTMTQVYDCGCTGTKRLVVAAYGNQFCDIFVDGVMMRMSNLVNGQLLPAEQPANVTKLSPSLLQIDPKGVAMNLDFGQCNLATASQGIIQDLSGTDLRQIGLKGTDDVELDAACCEHCKITPGCEFWLRETGTGDNVTCALKKTPVQHVVSQQWRGSFASTQWCAKQFQDLEGEDVATVDITGNSHEVLDTKCCAACAKEAACHFWVRQAGLYGTQQCFLRKNAGAHKDSQIHRGGWKWQAPQMNVTYGVIYSKGDYFPNWFTDEKQFNELFRQSYKYIMVRFCLNCGRDHRIIYFRRKTKAKAFNAYRYLLYDWNEENNVIHKDFDLYSTYADALADTNPWNFCNYQVNTGFPGGCGPASNQANWWSSLMRLDGVQTYRWAIPLPHPVMPLYTGDRLVITQNGCQVTMKALALGGQVDGTATATKFLMFGLDAKAGSYANALSPSPYGIQAITWPDKTKWVRSAANWMNGTYTINSMHGWHGVYSVNCVQAGDRLTCATPDGEVKKTGLIEGNEFKFEDDDTLGTGRLDQDLRSLHWGAQYYVNGSLPTATWTRAAQYLQQSDAAVPSLLPETDNPGMYAASLMESYAAS